MIQEFAHATILKTRGDDVAYQVSEMIGEATHRALRQLEGSSPDGFQPTFAQGARYQFDGPVDDSPPAPPDPRTEQLLKEEPDVERPGGRDNSVSWVF